MLQNHLVCIKSQGKTNGRRKQNKQRDKGQDVFTSNVVRAWLPVMYNHVLRWIKMMLQASRISPLEVIN